MMKRGWMMMLPVLLCGSAGQTRFGDRLPSDAYLDPADREIARTGKGTAGRPVPCGRETREGGTVTIHVLPTEQCVKLLPARRYRGLWFNAFEGSRFCPEPARECTHESLGDKIWFNVDRLRGELAGRQSVLNVVEFIGRRTLHKGPYGHLGGSDHEMIVDRVIFIEPVKEPAPDAE